MDKLIFEQFDQVQLDYAEVALQGNYPGRNSSDKQEKSDLVPKVK